VKTIYSRNAWLFFAVWVPITLLTIAVWCVWVDFGGLWKVYSSKWIDHEKKAEARVRLLTLKEPVLGVPC
jgi:hypothetical protein